jgi:hypothetical protein
LRRATASLRTTALAALVLAAAGCGSPPLSDIQLSSRAGAICARADRQLAAVTTPAGAAGGKGFLTRGIAALEPAVARLQALKPPKDDSDVYMAGVNALAGELAALKRAVKAIDRGQDTVLAFRELQQELTPLESQGKGAWNALQIPACLSR